MKKIFVLPLLFLGVLVLSGCSLYGGTSKVPVPANQTPSQAMPTTTNVIDIQNFAFNPSVLTVKKGETVTWVNNDSALHQIKSVTFNSSQLSKGQTFSFTFDDTGNFDYLCSIHPSMSGKIIVEE